jgi:rhodanese-related sulfurtransferase
MNAFDAVGVRVSGGSACSSGKASGSHVLEAMHLHKWRAQNAIRMSFGPADSLQDIEEACVAIRSAGSALQAHCMIPQRPARADQAFQFLQNLSSGISELRSSQGNRAWLVRTSENKNFLIADCAIALSELNTKLACRGLSDTQVLLLDERTSGESSYPPWYALQTTFGSALLFKESRNNIHSYILFAPHPMCIGELNTQIESIEIRERTKLLACFVNSDSPIDSYNVYEWISGSLVNIQEKSLQLAQDHQKIECTRVELANQLSERNFLVLDVREPFESATSHLDEILIDLLGRRTTKKLANTRLSHLSFEIVPLSRLPQFIIDCMNNNIKQDILCVCRSGQRSLQAAQLLRRTASCNALSLQGGLAALLAPATSLSNAHNNETRQSK